MLMSAGAYKLQGWGHCTGVAAPARTQLECTEPPPALGKSLAAASLLVLLELLVLQPPSRQACGRALMKWAIF
jgi:hypothetical protein